MEKNLIIANLNGDGIINIDNLLTSEEKQKILEWKVLDKLTREKKKGLDKVFEKLKNELALKTDSKLTGLILLDELLVDFTKEPSQEKFISLKDLKEKNKPLYDKVKLDYPDLFITIKIVIILVFWWKIHFEILILFIITLFHE